MITLRNDPIEYPGSRRPACLLLHGLGAGVFEVCLLADFLQTLDYPVRAFHFPGHEGLGRVMPASEWRQWYGAVEAEFLRLKHQYGSVAVMGFSTGGTLALRLAALHSLESLVLLAPFLGLYRPPWLPIPLETLVNSPLPYVIPWVPRLGSPIRDREMQRLATQIRPYQTFSTWAVRSALDLIAQVRPHLHDITAPVLIVQSPLDRVVDPHGAQEVYDRVGSPLKKLLWLQHSDHILGLDLERDQVFAAIADFLALVAADPS
jgi:carboxylesterase